VLSEDLERADLRTWGTPEFFDAITAADEAAAARDIALDLNFGSAWPAGAPSIDEAHARQLVLGSVDVVGPTTFTGPLPPPAPEMLQAVERIAEAGISVVVLGERPSRARGWADHQSRDEAVRSTVARLEAVVLRVESPSDIGDALRGAAVLPALEPVDGEPLAFSPERRTTRGGDVLLMFNESNDDMTQRVRVNLAADQVRVFDPEQAEPVDQVTLDGEASLELELPAHRWRILVLDR
jgi:hypothetical protein